MEVELGTGAKRGGDGRSIFFFDFQRLKKLPIFFSTLFSVQIFFCSKKFISFSVFFFTTCCIL